MASFYLSRREVLMGIAAMSVMPFPALAAPEAIGQRGGVLKISHPTRVASLNVLQISGATEYLAMDMLYSGLTRMGRDMSATPDLATAWQADNDSRVFTFKLREGIRFHQGQPFTADDVVATFKVILDPASASPARSAVEGIIDTVTALDPTTVQFKLLAPYADFPLLLTHPNARIACAESLADLGGMNTRANGTGPFQQQQFDTDRILVLAKNTGYYAPNKPALDGVELHYFPDLAAESSSFLSGEMDAMLEVQQADYQRIAEAPGSHAQHVSSGRFCNIVMRCDQPPFDDVRVRRAMAKAVDRQMLVDIVLEGLGRPANDTTISPEYRFVADIPPEDYDPEGARQLLAQAGHPNGISIPLVCSNRPAIRSQVGIAVKQMALPAGFDIEVQTVPHDTYLANVWRKGNFYVGYWGMQPTEDAAFTLLFTSDAAFADTAWNNAKFDALVDSARAEPDIDKRRELYVEAQRLMASEKPSVVPFFQDVLTASREGVHNWTCHPMAKNFYVEDVWLDRAASA